MQVTFPPDGTLHPGELMTVTAFRDRLKLTESAMRSMRRNGLPVLRVGKRHFVSADDAIEHIRSKSKPVA